MKLTEMNEERGDELVTSIIERWSKIYTHQIHYLETKENVYQYEVEFSMPKNIMPIPGATVKVYFSLIDLEELKPMDIGEDTRFEYEFNFENESLIHKLDSSTMRTNMFESWINKLLEKKFKIGTQLHLGT